MFDFPRLGRPEQNQPEALLVWLVRSPRLGRPEQNQLVGLLELSHCFLRQGRPRQYQRRCHLPWDFPLDERRSSSD